VKAVFEELMGTDQTGKGLERGRCGPPHLGWPYVGPEV